MKEEFINSLKKKGYRITSQRKQLLELFYDMPEGEHLSAEELHKKLLDNNMKISLATLYRSLKFLVQNGFLKELDFGEDHKHYELNQPGKTHFHLICNKCGLTIDFKDKELIECVNKVASKQKEFDIVDYDINILGLCQNCK